ncbi:DUF192 domain-containing protein [Methylorubrum sp. POS3]|uniref:DUF192 domain-containing protein n=1 Tax=Methylorubrum sp. POS3 TaxID=2998492 RepID=UPI00372B488E
MRVPSKTVRILACLAALSAPLTVARAEAPATGTEQAKTEPLAILAQDGRRAFQVEVMRNDAQRAKGLMYRRSMPADHGMLFDFERPLPVNMWMKNTYIPLDMVFIRSDGSIARIAADTEPLSTQIIASGEPVLAVLELNAGTAAKLGIRAGDRIEHPLFRR